MTKFSAELRAPKGRNAPYACQWSYFWLGLKDFILEQTTGESESTSTAQVTRTSPVTTLFVALLALLALAVLVSQLAPLWISSPLSPSPRQLAEFTVTMTSMSAVALMVCIPALLGWKSWKFCHAMCLRGWEIRTGQRQAIRLA